MKGALPWVRSLLQTAVALGLIFLIGDRLGWSPWISLAAGAISVPLISGDDRGKILMWDLASRQSEVLRASGEARAFRRMRAGGRLVEDVAHSTELDTQLTPQAQTTVPSGPASVI